MRVNTPKPLPIDTTLTKQRRKQVVLSTASFFRFKARIKTHYLSSFPLTPRYFNEQDGSVHLLQDRQRYVPAQAALY